VLEGICDRSTDFSTALKGDIDAIDPVLIFFLRRIKRLHLTLYDPLSVDKPAITKRFRRVEWTPSSGIVSLKNEDANSTRNFFKHRLTINFDGTESRRADIKSTDIVLVFPVKGKSSTPFIRKKNPTFAYLPLGDFGFKVRYISSGGTHLLMLCTVCHSGRLSHYIKSAIGR
jgi:hypothetical protein